MGDQEKWNNIYQSASVADAQPIGLLQAFVHLLPSRGRALDLACGLAANAVLLARSGLDSDAWDISDAVVDKINQYASDEKLPLSAQARDLAGLTIPESSYDVIIISHYLDRTLFPALQKALKPGGLLFYQTFIKDVTDSYSGPRNPEFKLDRNELLHSLPELQLVFYREEGRLGDMSQGERNVAQLIAQKPAD